MAQYTVQVASANTFHQQASFHSTARAALLAARRARAYSWSASIFITNTSGRVTLAWRRRAGRWRLIAGG